MRYCSSFAWFSYKLQWFNKNTQFSIYPIWNVYSTSKTLTIQKKKKMISDCLTGEKFWMLIIWTSSTAGLSLKKCKKLYHSEKCKQSSAQFIIYNVIHRSCIISYCKSFTPHDIPIYDSADGRSNWWKWNYHSNYLQDKSIDLIC